MTTYAGWAFFGNTSLALAQSGLNMVLNVFGGPVVNAARAITYQVNGALHQLTNNITIVVKPYVVKSYAAGEIDKLMSFSFLSSKIYFSIQIFLVIIITFLTERILNLWLGHVPDYTVIFLNLVLIQSLIRSLHMPIDMLFSGKGDIKYYELAEGVILFLPVPISYILLKMGFPYYSAFISLIVVEVLHIFAITIICKKICGLPLANYYKKVIAPCTFCFIIYISMFVFNNYIDSSLAISIVNIVISLIITMSIMYLLGLDRNERNMLMSIVKRKNIK
jgi:O-antigen/teichoic acid export membrane protein